MFILNTCEAIENFLLFSIYIPQQCFNNMIFYFQLETYKIADIDFEEKVDEVVFFYNENPENLATLFHSIVSRLRSRRKRQATALRHAFVSFRTP